VALIKFIRFPLRETAPLVLAGGAKQEIRCAPVEMAKGRAALPESVVADQKPFSQRGEWSLPEREGAKQKRPAIVLPRLCLLHFESVICKFAFGDDLSIEEMDVSVGVTGEARVVRHHADGCAFTMQVLEKLHNGFAIF
jgi:hypothetical protein